jgi:hypothetical protein
VIYLSDLFKKNNVIHLEGDLVRKYCIVASKFLDLESFEDLEGFELDDDETWGENTGLVINLPEYECEIELSKYIEYMFKVGSVESYWHNYSYSYGEIRSLSSILFVLREGAEFTPFFKKFVEGPLDLESFYISFKSFLSEFEDDSILSSIGNFVEDEDDLNLLLTNLKMVRV